MTFHLNINFRTECIQTGGYLIYSKLVLEWGPTVFFIKHVFQAGPYFAI